MAEQREFNIDAIRADFPFFSDQKAIGFHYLDNANTSQKPQSVIDTITHQLSYLNANIHRGAYRLSEQATTAYENSRLKVANFLGGVKSREVIFTSGTTAAINLIAHSYGDRFLRAGDEILLTIAEHHSNIVPWQLLAQRTGAHLKYITLDQNYRLDLELAEKLLTSKTKIFAFAHVSNVLGTINPVAKLTAMARRVGAISVVDGAQAAPHLSLNMKELGCDFYALSSHKMLGPNGVGVLFGREELLEQMDPFMGGGQMIDKVGLETSTWAPLPYKFEAGTSAITQVIGLGAALDYLEQFDKNEIHRHIMKLSRFALSTLRRDFPEIKVYCQDGEDWVGVISFYHKKIHPHDMAAIQDSFNVCIRAGHHCAQPLMRYLNVEATSRISPYFYNTQQDIEVFFKALHKASTIF